MGILGVSTTVFVVMKITDVIDWNWLWVLSPMLFGIGVAVLVLLLYIGVLLVKAMKK